MTGADAIAKHARALLTAGVGHVFADQRDAMMNTSEFARHGLSYFSIPWTATNKGPAVSQVRAWMREGQLILPRHEGLRRELLGFEERITPNGAVTYAGRGKAHDDLVALLLTSALVELQGVPERGMPPGIPASPRGTRRALGGGGHPEVACRGGRPRARAPVTSGGVGGSPGERSLLVARSPRRPRSFLGHPALRFLLASSAPPSFLGDPDFDDILAAFQRPSPLHLIDRVRFRVP